MNLVVMDPLAGNSNTAVPTEQAVKTYVDIIAIRKSGVDNTR